MNENSKTNNKQINGKFINTVYVNIDGACKGNPGPAAIAVIVKDNYGKVLEEYKEFIGKSTNNLAEYKAAVKALELAMKYCRNKVYLFTDNQLLVNHLIGRYRIKKKELLKVLMEIKLLEGFFQKVRYFYIDRERNGKANELVNRAFGNLPSKNLNRY